MVRMKVMRKKTMMVVPRGQDMEEKSFLEEIGDFWLVGSCSGSAGGLGYRKANSETMLFRVEYTGGGGGRGLPLSSEDRELINQEPCSKSSDGIRAFSSTLGFGLRKSFPTF